MSTSKHTKEEQQKVSRVFAELEGHVCLCSSDLWDSTSKLCTICRELVCRNGTCSLTGERWKWTTKEQAERYQCMILERIV